jgi:hypothetical protein
VTRSGLPEVPCRMNQAPANSMLTAAAARNLYARFDSPDRTVPPDLSTTSWCHSAGQV